MSRFLLVVPPFTGHVNPAAGVAAELERRGHDVAWVAHPGVVGHLLPPGATVFDPGDGFLEQIVEVLPERDRLRGAEALKFLWDQVLCPLAVDMVPAVRDAVDRFEPDALLVDQQAHAGALVATERKLPWATSATTSAELVDPMAAVPKIVEWIDGRLAAVFDEVGLPELAGSGFDPRFSPELVLVYSVAELVGDVDRDPVTVAWVGPVLDRPADPPPFPWEWLDRYETNVLVSIGTLSHDIGGRFLATVAEAVAGQPYGVVLVAPEGSLGEVADNILVTAPVPQLDLLPRLDAVLCHAGHNTTCETLAHGLPLVVAPIRDDQPIIAEQVVRSGAGVRVRFARVKPTDITEAFATVLHDLAPRAAAGRLAEAFRAAGGVAAAADRLEALVADAR